MSTGPSHPDGIRYIAAQAKVSFDEKGIPIHLTGINQDITASEEEKIKIKKLHEQMKNDEKNIAHCLNHRVMPLCCWPIINSLNAMMQLY